jgi:hypothetical protein
MFTPELMVTLGTLMVIGSLVALAVAQSTRNWFFHGDPQTELQVVGKQR